LYKEIILTTFDSVFKNTQALSQKLFISTILISIINFYINKFIISKNVNIKELDLLTNESILSFLLIFLFIMLNISIAITTYRIIILGPSSVPKFGSYIFTLREFKFLFKSILMIIVIAIPIVFFVSIPFVGVFLGILIAILLSVRLSFIHPAIACNEKSSFHNSWRLTKGHTFLILFSIILFPIVFSISVGIVYSFLIEFLSSLISSYFQILYSFLNVFITVFSISALSSVYLYIKPKSANIPKKKKSKTKRDIVEKKKKDLYKIIIHDEYKVTFKSLKKEIEKQYKKIGFSDIVYDRKNAFILKNKDEEEAYISLRHENDEFIIQAKKTDLPILKILEKNKI